MMKRLQTYLVLGLALFLAGCEGPCEKISSISAPELTSGTADFSSYVAVGTSISAGYQSGGLVDRHQIKAFPAIFAQQVGKTVLRNGQGSFTFPSINQDGIPALLEIKSYSPLIVNNIGRTTGAPMNFSQNFAYNNLGVPGSLAFDFADTTSYYTTNAPLFRSNFTFFNTIVRGRGSILQQMLSLSPTFISYEYGTNEMLGAAISGVSTTVFPSASYAALLNGHMNAIHALAPNAKLALFTVPDVTSLPFCTTFPPATASLTTGLPVPLIGPGPASLATGDLVLLTASDSLAVGTGIPLGAYNFVNPAAPGNGRPLLDRQVLSAAEVATIEGVITDMNAAIDVVSQQPWIAKVDMGGILADVAANGLRIGGTLYTSDYITGGLFSLDGVHPNDLAHAVLTNAMIRSINARFGATIPSIRPLDHAGPNASRMQPERLEGHAYPTEMGGLDEGLRALFPWRR